MTTRYQATPRGRQWHVEPEPSRWWTALKALAVLAMFVACSIDQVRW